MESRKLHMKQKKHSNNAHIIPNLEFGAPVSKRFQGLWERCPVNKQLF